MCGASFQRVLALAGSEKAFRTRDFQISATTLRKAAWGFCPFAKMISRSLYIARTDDPISVLADGLSICESNRFHHGDSGVDYSFFQREENSLFFGSVGGSFNFATDINLFGLDWPTLESKLLALSGEGLLIAIPDEDSDIPFDFLLYENGTKTRVQIFEEETDQLQIWNRR